jgi:hypothetical protein
MAEKLGTATRNAIADAVADLYDGGTLKIYTGSQPATADTAPTGSLLATITLPTPAFGASSSGAVAKAGTWSVAASATGTAGYFRLKTAGDTHPIDGTIGATGSGEEMELDNTSITSGQSVTVSSFTITQPAS